ncbi:hypothetical protein Caci_5136 [Catenulispora acidiphila DSM 44928]|uniref:Uncharacterized protein n=1 Tax=Catenulispora acidiphila (strain DSM 44928 / JCM 14897 / NBRC 102108 / NRRL B-24433 / ID139908) TaxID=479433 RepID=C7Q6G0_CATAD|nr:hypothetical protein [Catenulispora acidiphila]ACU73995.1 hypothetical protein Caci_5136 [Catenulispora acidiphila DSM 44928]
MPDLYLDSRALSDFAARLQSLTGDLKAPIYSEAVCSDVLNDNLESFSINDTACGSSLNDYLTALAAMATSAAAAAEQLDEDLAAQARQTHVHGHMIEAL